MRGEDPPGAHPRRAPSGSPPRAWGGLRATRASSYQERITPACVGRTTRSARTRRSSADHPHVRGEDQVAEPLAGLVAGSPPRAWGGRAHQLPPRFSFRITPTCVGRTALDVPLGAVRGDHPHVRGEDRGNPAMTDANDGSPPRAWGGRIQPKPAHLAGGITPTCVGRTPAGPLRASRGGDHPHVRGEDRAPPAADARFSGSPPRAWGGPRERRHPPRRRRITPTCVGRTCAGPRSDSRPADHPHVRGEDTS